MSRGARPVARLLAGAPATSVNLDDLDADWRPLAEVLLDAPDRGAALEAALAQRPDGQGRQATSDVALARKAFGETTWVAPGAGSEGRASCPHFERRFGMLLPAGRRPRRRS